MTDADEMVDLMRYASQAKVAKALGVTKTATNAWAAGRNVTPYRLRQVRDLLRPEQTEAAPPQWAERLLAGMMALETKQAVSAEELAAAQARAAIYLAAGTRKPQRPGGDGAGGASSP